MPWKETQVFEERLKFVTAYLEGSWSIDELWHPYGVSRKTAYEYIERYTQQGVEGRDWIGKMPEAQAHWEAKQVFGDAKDERSAPLLNERNSGKLSPMRGAAQDSAPARASLPGARLAQIEERDGASTTAARRRGARARGSGLREPLGDRRPAASAAG